jgi:hypothetical protein
MFAHIHNSQDRDIKSFFKQCFELLGTSRFNYTLVERKSRMPQIQGVQGQSRPAVAGLRALGNAEDGVSSAFPTCWVVAESEAQRVNKMECFLTIYISPLHSLYLKKL